MMQILIPTSFLYSGVRTEFQLGGGGGIRSMLVSCPMQCYIIYTHLRSQLSDSNLKHLMKVTIEGPPLKDVDFNAIMDIFKTKNKHIEL